VPWRTPDAGTSSSAGSPSRATRFAEIVAETALGCTAWFGLSAGSRVRRLLRAKESRSKAMRMALRIELHVVVEHGLNLARLPRRSAHKCLRGDAATGFEVAAVEVVIQRVRVGA